MPRWKVWERKPDEPGKSEPEVPPTPTVAPHARGFQPPRQRTSGTPATPTDQKLVRLLHRRDAVLFDVEQAEMAGQPDNPWRERIKLLDEALATVVSDRTILRSMPVRPGLPLQREPVRCLEIKSAPPIEITFQIGDERFEYEEEIDWAERGTQLAQPELVLRAGDPARLVPAEFPEERRLELVDHLTASLFVFAVDLRDRALNGLPILDELTLASLARPCETCGGWQDIHGMCAECQRRRWRQHELDEEEERLRADRAREEEECAKLADRLPVARRRLAEVDAEIAEYSS